MAFNTQEQEIIKYGVANGKSRQEVETALSNFRSGIVPQPKPVVQEQPSLGSKLGERAKTFGKEALALGTLGASTMTEQDFNATGQDRSLATLQGLNRAGQSPIRMAGAVGGAIGDVVGAGLEATGLAEPIGKALAPVVQSDPVQKAMEAFKTLPQETQDVLGAIVNTANIPLAGGAKSLATSGLQKTGQFAKESVAPLAGKILPKLTPDAEQIMQRVARVSKGKQAGFEAKAGESIGAYLDKRGIYGDVDQITEQLYNRFQQSKGTADNALASLQGNYQPTVIRTALAELEKKLTRVSSTGATDPNLGKVTGLLAKFDNQGLTMSEINEAKRLYERNVKLDFLRENNPEGITTANNIDNAIRSWQFKQAEKLGLKNLPEINKETMLAKQLLDDLGKEYSGSAGNNMITLTDWIVLSGGDPTAVAGFLTKQGLSSKKVQSFIAKLISKNQPKKGGVIPQTGEATVLPIGTYKDFLKETSKTSKPTTQPQPKKGLSPSSSTLPPKEGVVNELINNPLRGSVTPSEFLPKKKVGSSQSWSELQKTNPDLFNTGILRKSQSPYKAVGEIPKDVHNLQGKWQNYGQYDEISADKIYDKVDNYGYYLDKDGNPITNQKTGNYLVSEKEWDDYAGSVEKTNISNQQLRDELIQSFTTPEGKKYLNEVIDALPKNPDGTINAYRIGTTGQEGIQSYTLSEGMAKTFSNQGTDVLPAGTPGLPAKGYKDFGSLPVNTVKIDPKGIKAWSPYDAEILVEPKFVKVATSLEQEAKKYKSAEEFVNAQETRTGVEVRDKIGTKLQDPYTAEYLPTNPDGTITIYHSTTKEGAEKIKQSGILGSKTEDGNIYFTTNKKGYGGIGKDKDVVLAFNVDPNKVKFDDVYRGELHLKGNNADIGGIKPVKIKTKSQLTDIWKKANKK